MAADAGLRLEYVAEHDDRHRRVGWLRPARYRYRTPFRATDVWDRRTHRGDFAAGPAGDTLAAVDLIARQAGGVRVVPHAGDLGTLLRAADRQLYADPAIVAELRRWLRLDPAHPSYRADGLDEGCLALSRPAAAGLRAALAAYPVLRPLGLPRLLAAAGGDPLARGGTVLVLTAPAGLGPAGQVEFGRVLLRIWLTLHAAGLAAHPLSQLIDVAATRTALGALLDVAPERLLHVTRVGHPVRPAPRSARRVGGVRV